MVNIITGHLSAADTRALKALLDGCGLDYVLLPDLSQNLDGGHEDDYNRLPQYGTTLDRICLMAGARMTLELAPFCPEDYSPGAYLRETYGVPMLRMNLPVGLRDTDAFVATLEALGGQIPAAVREERARYLDAMIDAHKYNAQCRVAVYGEPDMVLALVRASCENGAVPVVAATGSRCASFEKTLAPDMTQATETQFSGDFDILNFADFAAIENALLARKANLMLGNSDGRRIEERHHVPLLRYGFPIHDRVGGQRTRLLFYDGSLSLMEATANAMLQFTENSFREELLNKYFKDDAAMEAEASRIEVVAPASDPVAPAAAPVVSDLAAISAERTKSHPCFSCGACATSARVHLPIAPKCNLSCNYCLRKYDCVNESRPGVTTAVLTPAQAFDRFMKVKHDMPNLTVVGIAGPGDTLANPEETLRTLEMIRREDPNITFCMSTNGLALPEYVEDIKRVGVSHATVTINAVDPVIGAQIYKFAMYRGKKYTGETAAALLLANQMAGLRALSQAGIVSKVNTVLLKGINDGHIPQVVETARELGAVMTNIMQLIPVKGSVFENMPLVSNKELMDMRRSCEPTLKQMYHCKQCRADAVGLLGDDKSIDYRPPVAEQAPVAAEIKPAVARKIRIAVASKTGMTVDQHFGQAEQFYIYESDGAAASYVETRSVSKYCNGMDDCGEKAGRMAGILAAVDDCKGVLALRIGESPLKKLETKGIRVFTLYENVDKAVNDAAKALCG